MADNSDIQDAIIGAATQYGIDPAWALSVAERESDFNPNARASKTIEGVFQMTKGLRDKYGIGDSKDPATQADGFMKYVNGEIRPQMQAVLGRDPTPQEMYLGHHFGPARAARMIAGGQGDTPVQSVFTAQEMAGNPHFARAGTTGNLMSSITSDMDKRMAKFGGGAVPSNTATNSPAATGTVAANTVETPLDYVNDPVVGGQSEEPAKQPAKKQAAPEEITHDDTGLGPIKAAMAPVIPQQVKGSGLPILPSISTPKIPTQADVLTGKPGLAGALSPLMGTA